MIAIENGTMNDPSLVPLNHSLVQIVNVLDEKSREVEPKKTINIKSKNLRKKFFEIEEGEIYTISILKVSRKNILQAMMVIRGTERGFEILRQEGDCGKISIEIVP